jgi:competence protein ComEC
VVHRRLFILSVGVFCLGCVVASLNLYTGWFFILSFIFASAIFFFNKKRRGFSLLFFIFSFGCFYPYLYSKVLNRVPEIEKFPIHIIGKVVTYPVDRSGYSNFKIETENIGKVEIFADTRLSISYGNKVSMDCDEGFEKGVLFCRNLIMGKNGCSGILCPFFSARSLITKNLRKSFSPASSALALGLLFGDRSGFTEQFNENLSLSGTTHIVALSGFNITVIVSFIGTLLFFIPYKFRLPAIIAGIFIFIMVVGPSSSVVRAAIMGSLAVIGKNIGRSIDIRGPIAFSAGIMVLWNPAIIVFDAGFILSFSALFGIVFVAPRIKNILSKITDKIGGAVSMIIECVSAQLTAMPAIFLFFGSINCFSFIPNALIIWTIPLVMLLSFISGAGPLIIGSALILPFRIMAEAILSYEIGIINIFAGGF